MKLSPTLAAIAILLFGSGTALGEAIPKWRVACERTAKDKFGEKQRQFCSLLVFNQRPDSALVMDDQRTFTLNSRTLVEVDSLGLHPTRPPGGSYCRASRLRIAVDGKRIDGLPGVEQLRAMASGKIFVWEEQADWPNCVNKAPHGTSLDGFREALIDLQSQFDSIRVK